MVMFHSKVYGEGEIISVEEFNRRAEAKYREAVANYEPSKGGFPSRAMALYLNRYGEKRKKGFVWVGKNRSMYAETKRGLLNKVA